jgi:hypothetical protein
LDQWGNGTPEVPRSHNPKCDILFPTTPKT